MQETEPRAIQFELQHPENLPWLYLNPATQTRKYYQPEGMEELTRAIRAVDASGEPQYKLFHPLMVNILDSDKAAEYIEDLNLCHGTEHTLDEFRPTEDGRYYFIIAGHRRHRAIGELIREEGANPALSTVPCSVYENLSFSDSLRIQIDENTHQSLSVTEVARAIQSSYKYGVATGKYSSIADCVRDLPFGEDKVRNALKFCELPEYLQEWVEDERLSYGSAVALHPLMLGLRKRHDNKSPEIAEAITQEYLLAFGLKIVKNGWNRSKVMEHVSELTQNWLKEGEEQTLFELDEYLVYDEARKYRHRVTREFFGTGVNLLRHFRAIAGGKLFDELPAEHKEAMLEDLRRLYLELGGTALETSDESVELDLFAMT